MERWGKQLGRRNFLNMAATAAVTTSAPRAAFAEAGGGVAGKFVPETPASARSRFQQRHLPNIPLVTHEGKQVRFYDDLVKDKAVTLNFFYALCGDVCPAVTANLVEVQKLLGDLVGLELFMYSITLRPEADDVLAIQNYRETFGAGPGWTFLTGEPNDIEKLRRALGFVDPNPERDKDTTQHIGNVRYGNEPLMVWAACPGMAKPSFIADSISWVARPGTKCNCSQPQPL
jgi:protein SCO1/2